MTLKMSPMYKNQAYCPALAGANLKLHQSGKCLKQIPLSTILTPIIILNDVQYQCVTEVVITY